MIVAVHHALPQAAAGAIVSGRWWTLTLDGSAHARGELKGAE
jgi:hypothetical protein